MRWADIKKRRTNESGASGPDPRPLDLSLVQFVEALAVADARRDHLDLSDAVTRRETGGLGALQAGGSAHGARSHLRKILD
jgi:hypothetical protein